MDDARARFDEGAGAWVTYNQGPMGRIRRELTWYLLEPHLPAVTDRERPPRVLDAGGGSGELALRLAECGYEVWLVDYAPSMLEEARRAFGALRQDARARIHPCLMAADARGLAFARDQFDAVTCHNLIEYVAQPRATLQRLAGLLRPGGLFSVSFVNRHAEVLRQATSLRDPVAALARLEDGQYCARLFGIPGRTFAADEVAGWLAAIGLEVLVTAGVRAFTEQVPRSCLDDPVFFENLVRLEKAVIQRTPYCLVARYGHLLARRPSNTAAPA